MEKKNMILLTAEWRKNNPPPSKQVPKTSQVASSSNSNMESSHKIRTRAKERHQPQTLTARVTESQRFGRMPWRCIPDCQTNDGSKEKGGSHIKISEMKSDIFDAIPELYEAKKL
ncbi:hypothetical protein O181_111124 [Austropuccinia psidii MF-1]|uniref:Uncharacterized protein n=1 Tax=Austropuccinia psidii MF-1 TaxID=1389203 RepID=A0A9Q3JZI9_9BASI|nr:hypothetical protein [Austropuccinia psidii MF-1]